MPRRSLLIALCLALFAAGLALLIASKQLSVVTRGEIVVGCAGLLLGWIRPVAAGVAKLSANLDAFSPRKHSAMIAIAAMLIAANFYLAAWRGDRPLVPMIHDEQMYLLQTRQLASGHLAMPALPLGQFFDTFYVLVKPVYASMYFPGTALAYVPSLWLHLPFFAWPMLMMTAFFMATYVVAARMVGRLLGLVVAFSMLATPPMTSLPTATMSHPLGALFGMLMLYAWLRWRERPSAKWAIMLGAAAGWMAITRPLESLAFGFPILIAIVLATRRPQLAVTLGHAAIAFACALPFIGLQLATNHAVTGTWTKLPISLYIEQEFPGMNALGKAPATLQTTSTLPEKQAMLTMFVRPVLLRDSARNRPAAMVHQTSAILKSAMPSPLLFLLLPLALIALRRTQGRVLWAIFACFCGAYVIYGNYLTQYSCQIMGVVLLLAVSAIADLKQLFPARASRVTAAGALFVAGVTSVVLVILPTSGYGGWIDWQTMRFNYETLPHLVTKPALVMIRYGKKSAPFAEPVYNLEAATPDDCPIIRAHDFGPERNRQLYDYYAAIQPGRNVYLFDRDSQNLRSIGTVSELATAPPATRP